jgi:pyridoxine 5-phosphate synthase
MPDLTVKLDHVAMLRKLRERKYPEPAAAAVLAELAGADRIAVHLCRHRGHVLDRDVRILRQIVQTELVLEMAITTEMVGTALEIKPERVILVAEHPKSAVVEEGVDLLVHLNAAAEAVKTLENGGISVCLCIDPDLDQVKMAHKIDAAMVQFHTGRFCRANNALKRNRAFMKIVDAVHLAAKLRLGVGLGHDLCYQSIGAFKSLSQIDEYYVGHSIVSRAVLVGMERAVKEMLALIKNG